MSNPKDYAFPIETFQVIASQKCIKSLNRSNQHYKPKQPQKMKNKNVKISSCIMTHVKLPPPFLVAFNVRITTFLE